MSLLVCACGGIASVDGTGSSSGANRAGSGSAGTGSAGTGSAGSGANPAAANTPPHQVLPNERQLQFSTTKSFLSALVGIALGEGALSSLNARAADFFPDYASLEPSPQKSSITLENLLTMRSGLAFVEGDRSTLGTPDPARTMFSRQVTDLPVGTIWNYSSSGANIIAEMLRVVTGKTPLAGNGAADKSLSPPRDGGRALAQTFARGCGALGGWAVVRAPPVQALLSSKRCSVHGAVFGLPWHAYADTFFEDNSRRLRATAASM